MKNITTICMVVLLGLVQVAVAGVDNAARTESSTKVGWWQRNFGLLTWQEAVDSAAEPADITAAVARKVRFHEDAGVDTWTGGKETYARGFGDCEDIAAAVVDLCKAKGWEAWTQVFSVRGTFDGHAVAMGRWQGRLWVSNGSYHPFVAVKSVEEAQRVVAQQMKWRAEDVISKPLADIMGVGLAQDTSSRSR